MSETETKVTGYVMKLDGFGAWMFLGTTPEVVGKAFAEHIRKHEGLSVDEIDAMRIKAVELTQEDLDNMPEFPGRSPTPQRRKASDMSETLTQPIKWHGGKHYLADWIISHMPPHKHYVEPFFGGGSVLLRKDPEGVSEVVNDLNRNLSYFWMALQNPAHFTDFQKAIDAAPFSESEFEDAKRVLATHTYAADIVEIAVAFFIVARQSRQGLMKDFATMSRTRTRRGMNEQVSSWLTAIDGLVDVHARLRRVVIFNRDAMKVIEQQDGPETLFYLDPPYLHETRVTTKDYHHEMDVETHHRLLSLLATLQGRFVLSGYPSDLYERHARNHGWRCVTRDIDNKASSAKSKAKKTECLWMNY